MTLNFTCEVRTRRSTSGIVSMYNGSAWADELQRFVFFSTTETEFIAAREGAKELEWFKRLLEELGVIQQYAPTTRAL